MENENDEQTVPPIGAGKRYRIHRNADNAALAPIVVNRFAIGHVDEINGEGAKEMPAFVPTRHELFVLAKYWIREIRQLEFFEFLSGQTGSREMRMIPFGWRRVERISKIDRSVVDAAVAEAGHRCRRRRAGVGPRGLGAGGR